jgi:nucleoside-diphosphate-sugar epimerase
VQTVVVTGVAGSLGRRVSARLADRDDVDRVIGIDVVPPETTNPKVDVRLVDLSYPPPFQGPPPDTGPLPDKETGADEVSRLFEVATSLIHLAWRTPDSKVGALDGLTAQDANRRALERVLRAVAGSSIDMVVHVSSATVYGAWPDNQVPLTEEAPLRPNPEFLFAVGKAEAERALAEWAGEHPGVTVAVLRPTVTVGGEERPLYQALSVTRSPGAGDGRRPVQYLHVDDLADAVVLAWDRRLSGVYNVAPDTGVREDDARALAGGVARVTLPSQLAQTVAAWGWQLWRRGVPTEARAYATHPWVVAPDRLKAAGWTPNYSSEEALVATDVRTHWDDLPPGRRQNYNLLIAGAGTLAVVAAIGAGVAAVRQRRRR